MEKGRVSVKRSIYVAVLLAGLVSASRAGEARNETSIQAEMRRQIQLSDEAGRPQFSLSGTPFDEPAKQTPVKTPQPRRAGGKKAWKALALSALVPGAGEYYLGHRGRARIFFTGEALSWIGYGSFRMYGHWRKDDMTRWARDRAGAELDGKSDFHLDMVGFYEDIDEYNTFGRVMDPDRPYLFDTPANHWRWQDSSDQKVYRDLKNQSREAYRRSNFMIGVMVVNRIVSVVDVFQMVLRSRGKFEERFSTEEQTGLRVQLDPGSLTRQVVVSLPVSW